MVKIRLMRLGKKNDPVYRVVATDSQKKRGGKFLAILGFYHPRENDKKIDKKAIEALIAKGAVPTPAVTNLIK